MNPYLDAGLKSKVARRLFAMFMVAALIPVGGLSLFTYTEVSDTLIDLNYRRLQQDAKSIGMELIQQLLWHQQMLDDDAKHYAQVGAEALAAAGRRNEYRTIAVMPEAEQAALTAPQRKQLARPKGVLRFDARNEAEMIAVVPGSERLLKAEMKRAALWTSEFLSDRYCVLTLEWTLLYCTDNLSVPPPQKLDEALGRQNSGVFEWQTAGEAQLGAYWRAPLEASFALPGFVVVVSDPKRDVLALLNDFRQIFPAIVVLALALAAWLAIVQIRSQMQPLDRLEKGTRRLAQGDFGSRVEVAGNDEFASLAGSFNRMADSLDHKFNLLQALGELDRAILSASDIETVIRLLLENSPRATSCDECAVLRFDGEGNVMLWSIAEAAADAAPQVACLDVDAAPYRRSEESWRQADAALLAELGLHRFVERGATQALLFPARVGERIDSILLLAFRRAPPDRDEIVQSGRSLADRLSAAAFSLEWEDKLYHQAHYDALTDLPNRALLRDRVKQALLRGEREKLAVGLMLIDLDDFKNINDSLGHSAGDQLLVSCAKKLLAAARNTDTVARLGGDEFVVLVPDLHRHEAGSIVDRIANDICLELASGVEVGDRSISSTASIGIAIYPDNGKIAEDLLKNADAAMYESKRLRRGSYQFYSDEMNAEVAQRFQLAQDLRRALDQVEFRLVYQPKIDRATRCVTGGEALVRWVSPTRGFVSPGQFIPMVDELGLGDRMGTWVMREACKQMAAWDAQGCPPITISVNISPAQFSAESFVDDVRDALQDNNLEPWRLELEILESMAVGGSEGINDTLKVLRGIGVGIALDDFGTGYSSLVYLTQLSANVLKIDRGFIVNLMADERQQAIVHKIISLAQALDYKVVAEGVEEAEQVRLLAEMGCDVFQGYFFSKPIDPAAFVAFQRGSLAGAGVAAALQ